MTKMAVQDGGVMVEKHYEIYNVSDRVVKVGPDPDGLGLVRLRDEDGNEFFLYPEVARKLATVLPEVADNVEHVGEFFK